MVNWNKVKFIGGLFLVGLITTGGVFYYSQETTYRLNSTDNSKVQLAFHNPGNLFRESSYDYKSLPNTIEVTRFQGSTTFFLLETWIENGTALSAYHGPFTLKFQYYSWENLPVFYLHFQNVTVQEVA